MSKYFDKQFNALPIWVCYILNEHYTGGGGLTVLVIRLDFNISNRCCPGNKRG